MRVAANRGPLFMPRTPASICLLISQWLFLAVVFLVPIVVTPWTTDIYETSKQAILVIGIMVSAACYMVSLLLERRSMSRPSMFTLVPLLILIVTCVSAGASLAPMTSWIGQGAQEYVSVLSLVGCIVLFFLTQALLRDSRLAERLVLTLFSSSTIVGLALLPSFFGVGDGSFTNLLGTPHACAMYLLIMSTLACGFWLVGYKSTSLWAQRALKGFTIVTYIACLVILLALDSPVLWTLALVASGTLFAAAFIHADKFQDPLHFTPAMGLFVLGAIFLVLPTRFPSPFLQEVSPNLETTWGIANGAWNEGSLGFGSGPGTFSLVYSKYVALGINQSEFWDIIFDRGSSFVTTQLATVGIVGVLSWLFFAVLLLAFALKKLVNTDNGWRDALPMFAAWFVIFVGSFIYAQNITLVMLFWLLSGVLASLLVPKHESQPQHEARARLATVFVTVLVLVCAVTTVFLTMPRYFADVTFARAINKDASADTAEEVDELIRLLDKAAVTNPWNDTYYRNLAGAVLHRLSLLSSEESADNEYVQSLIATAISATEKATDLSPANVLNWEVRGLVYRELLSVVPDAAQPSIDAFEKAIELAPINPRYRVEAARAYLGIADSQNPLMQSDDGDVVAEAEASKEAAMAHAEEHLLTAIALKSDYAVAHYYLALLRERQGQLAEAVKGLELVVSQAPNDVGVGLQLGLLYLRQGKNDLAQVELQRVIELAPAYANAHWYLSVVFEQKGDLAKAIAEVEQVLATNPENVTVQTRLDRLQAGQTSETIPDPVTPVSL